MPNRFCAICGKGINSNAPHFGMCLKCYLKENPLFELPNKFSFTICLDCGSYRKKDEWNKTSNDDLFFIIREATSKFLLKNYLKEGKLTFNILWDEDTLSFSSKDLLKSLDLRIEGFSTEDRTINYQQIVTTNINYELCKNCSNLRTGLYFLSIVQLRVKEGGQFNYLNDIIEAIREYVEDLFEKDERQYITKIEDQKLGVDLYLSTNELMNYIISFLRGKYHFFIKRSKKLVGRDTQKGRNLYRLKTLVKFIQIKKNDIILIGNSKNKYIVQGFTKNRVILKGEDGSKLTKNFSYFFNQKVQIQTKGEFIG